MNITAGLSEGQVLQRRGRAGASLTLSGECAVAAPLAVTITRAGRALAGWRRCRCGVAKGGRFSLRLSGIPAGGPYRLRVEAGKADAEEVGNFYVGDVWILAGQSNMEGSAKMPALVPPHTLVRAFSLRREWRPATDPMHVHVESPDVCHNYGRQITPAMGAAWRERAGSGAGAGIPFGREMMRRTGVPQGLICAAKGGSSLEQWNPADGAQLYASMLASVRATGQPVAGVLWYQGESDTGASTVDYTKNMRVLVAATRRDLRQPRLPWVMVQLARVFRSGDGAFWNSVQEQQRLLPGIIPRLQTVAAIDLPLDDEIHIGAAGMPRLGMRLARAADRLVHGNRDEVAPPSLRAVRRTLAREDAPAPKCGIDVSFDGIVGGIQADGEPTGFRLFDPQGVELPWNFKTTLHGDVVRLHLMRLPPPGSTLAYGHGFGPRCNLTDGRDLALPVFTAKPIEGDADALPFVTTWKVYPVVATATGIDTVKKPALAGAPYEVKTYGDGFINEHDAWQRQSGHAFLSAILELEEARSLQFLMGYDGPFRLWLNGKSFFCDPRGANPCIADQSGKTVRLAAGRHEIVVGMDTAHGRTWGFFLRFRLAGRRSLSSTAGCTYAI